jgi:hypothetical protein
MTLDRIEAIKESVKLSINITTVKPTKITISKKIWDEGYVEGVKEPNKRI